MRKTFIAALLAAACALHAGMAATLAGSQALKARHAEIAAELARNAFGEPLVLRSEEGDKRIEGHAWAVLDIPFAQAAPLLSERAQWCEILMLHLNNKDCRVRDDEGTPRVELFVGKKNEQPVQSATRLRFAWVPQPQRPGYLGLQLAAPDGPYDTRDYTLVFEAVPIEGDRTFVHLGYSFAYGGASRFAMRVYLATIGRDKVGFTRVGEGGGEPQFVDGMRGVVERNVMRYMLAIRTQLATAQLPADKRLDARLSAWFAATEKYPRQLHEIESPDYLRMKKNEFRRMTLPQPGDVAGR